MNAEILFMTFKNAIKKIREAYPYLTKSNLNEITRDVDGELENIRKLCNELHSVKDNQIVIYPDFDCDGIMAGTILYAGLNQLGFDAQLYVPDASAGYGMQNEQIDTIKDMFPKAKTIITCDTGITACEQVDYANSLGYEVLITDHHQQSNELPDAKVIVDPCQKSDDFAYKSICGAYVAFKVLQTYVEMFEHKQLGAINQLAMFAAVGTLGDSMDLKYNSRVCVIDGLRNMCNLVSVRFRDGIYVQEYNDALFGLYTLIKSLIVDKHRPLTAESISFYVVPVLNSCKRMNADMHVAFDLFRNETHNIDKLVELNEERKSVTESIFKDITSPLAKATGKQPYAPLAYFIDTPYAIAGLIANKVMSDSHAPVLVLSKNTDETLHGSARSPEWLDYRTLLRECGASADGHAQACGVTFENEEVLKRALETITNTLNNLTPEDKTHFELDYPTLDKDVDIEAVCDFINECEPYGKGFEKPKIRIIVNAKDIYETRQLGKNQEHLKITLRNGKAFLAWNTKLTDSIDDKQIEIIGDPGLNNWMGTITEQVIGTIKIND